MRTSLNIPEDQLAQFDQIWQSQGMNSRSRAVREAMLEYIESHQDLAEMTGTVAAVVVFDYSYDDVVEEIHRIQHDFDDLVHATSHVHHGHWCLETVHCTGTPENILELMNRLRNFDEIRRVKLMVIDSGDDENHHHE